MENKIRNICLVGHNGHGKTSVAEAMLYISKTTNRLGKIGEGNTVLDYDAEEKKRGFSISLSVAPINWKGVKINIIDTPGYLDFAAEAIEGKRVADSVLIVTDGRLGVEVGTELAWDRAVDSRKPRAFFLNRFDDPEARFAKAFKQLRDKFGVSVCPIMIPMVDGDAVIGFLDLIDMKEYVFDKEGSHVEAEIPEAFKPVAEEYRNMLYESIAQTSEELMEKFFGGEEITRDEAVKAIQVGFVNGDIAPVICGSAAKTWGIEILLDHIADYFPSPVSSRMEYVIDKSGELKTLETSADSPTSIFVFKTIADPFVGKMSFFRVMNGSLKKDTTLYNVENGTAEKFSHIYNACGKDLKEVELMPYGDIGVTTKLANVSTNSTYSVDQNDLPFRKISVDVPYMRVAVSPLAKGEEDKLSQGISRLLEEDMTLRFVNEPETKQLVLSGMGDIHIDVTLAKLKARYGVGVALKAPKIAYREAIRKSVDAEGKHKKQSGGHGQYGHVKIRFSPSDEAGLHFTESCVGGSVPKNFHPAVVKGLEEAMQKGVLAGFPMVGLNADLYDGSYHDVDSSEMSFKLAASLAYKDGMKKANPVILEPYGELKVNVPDSLVGDVIGTVNKRRGRILGMTPMAKKGYQTVEAEVPMSEMSDYSTALRALSQGRGNYTFEFIRYEEAPAPVAEKIIADASAEE